MSTQTKIIKTIDQIEIVNNNILASICNEITKREGTNFNKKICDNLKYGYKPIIFEATEYNIYTEYDAMTKFIKKREFQSNYEKGRYMVLEFMLNCIIADPIDGNYYEKKNRELIKEAGKLLSTDDAMDDDLVWSFVPKRFRRDIDVSWNGIGSWQA